MTLAMHVVLTHSLKQVDHIYFKTGSIPKNIINIARLCIISQGNEITEYPRETILISIIIHD